MIRNCILLASVILIVGCDRSRYDRAFELDQSTFDAGAMEMIRKDTGFSISEGARGLNFAYKPPVDPAFVARIEIPSEDRESIEKQLAALKGNRIEVRGGLADKIKWWRPMQGRVIVDKLVFDPENGTTLHGVLSIEAENLILYIDWST